MKQSFSVCAVFDVKHNHFHSPFIVPVDGNAVRWFSDQVSSGKGSIGEHPSEYELYKFGEYDLEDDMFSYRDKRAILTRGSDVASIKSALDKQSI